MAGRLPPTDLTARDGEVVAVTGPPGSGKSTLLACLAGLLEPSAGTVRACDPPGAERVDPWRWPSAMIASTFGVVFQNPEHQFVTGRVVDEVRFGLAGAGVAEPEAGTRAAQMLERLHLSHLAAADPFTLSGGEQRRLSVGTALALDPGILLLDEPTFGQDPATWAELVGIIADHRDAGGAVVMATHDPDLVRALGAREVRLGGRSGEPAGPTAPPARESFGLSTLEGHQPEQFSGAGAPTPPEPGRAGPAEPGLRAPPCGPPAAVGPAGPARRRDAAQHGCAGLLVGAPEPRPGPRRTRGARSWAGCPGVGWPCWLPPRCSRRRVWPSPTPC